MHLLETIKLHNRKLHTLSLHSNRMNSARQQLFNRTDKIDLAERIKIPESTGNDLYKCRVLYSDEIIKTEFILYKPRTINSLMLVYDNTIDYRFKYADRSCFHSLQTQLNKTGADDVLIVRNGKITDTSFSNIVFRAANKWITPAYPLLKGTKREELLQKGKIYEEDISVNDLKLFDKALLINAMLNFDEKRAIGMNHILV